MDIFKINKTFKKFLFTVRLPISLEHPKVIELLDEIVITNYIRASVDYKMYSIEFVHNKEFYYIYKMASNDSFNFYRSPISNGGIEAVDMMDVWQIGILEKLLFFRTLNQFVFNHFQDLKSTVEYKELDKKRNESVDYYFSFLMKHSNFIKKEGDGWGCGDSYYFGRELCIHVKHHPYEEVWVPENMKSEDEWFLGLVDEVKRAKRAQRNAFYEEHEERRKEIEKSLLDAM